MENVTPKNVPPATVLLVDDEPEITESMESILNMHFPQFIVRTADSGAAALAIMETTPIHIIITDHQMPAMNGLTFILAARRKAPNAAIIMLTGFPEMDVAIKALNMGGITFFLTKPVGPKQLITAVMESVQAWNSRVAKARALTAALEKA